MKKAILTLSCAAALFFSACEKEKNVITPDPIQYFPPPAQSVKYTSLEVTKSGWATYIRYDGALIYVQLTVGAEAIGQCLGVGTIMSSSDTRYAPGAVIEKVTYGQPCN